MAFTETLSDFINTDTPGNVACVLGGASFVGLWDDAYADAIGIGGSRPSVIADAGDVASASIGDSITVAGAAYTIAAIKPDGFGGATVLELEET